MNCGAGGPALGLLALAYFRGQWPLVSSTHSGSTWIDLTVTELSTAPPQASLRHDLGGPESSVPECGKASLLTSEPTYSGPPFPFQVESAFLLCSLAGHLCGFYNFFSPVDEVALS